MEEGDGSMKKSCVVLDEKVINIGEWDYQKYIDEDGNEVIGNPLPIGAIEGKREFEQIDGGWCEVGIPKVLNQSERIEMLEDTINFLLGL
jgi:hypothetical protein